MLNLVDIMNAQSLVLMKVKENVICERIYFYCFEK